MTLHASPSSLLARLCAFLILIGGVAPAAQADVAQIAVPLGDGTGVVFDDPGELSDDRFAPTRRRTEGGASSDAGRWITPLRPLRFSSMQSGQVWRFTGELHSEEFALHVADPTVAKHLRLRTQSTVNALPERSSLRVVLNDTEIGEIALRNFTGFEDASIDVPPGLLVPGRNTVRLEVAQHHRIFCGPDASWALWTEIDLARSGLAVDPSLIEPGPESFVMALAADAGSAAGIELRGTQTLGAMRDDWLRAITTRLGNVLSGQPLAFRFTRYWTVMPDAPARARVSFLPSSRNDVRFLTGADGAQVMLVEFVPGSEVAALPALDGIFPVPPLHERATLIEIEREVALAEFGVPTERFAQRFARREYAFRLPDDWLILTAEKARLRLDYVYAGGLPDGSVLVLFMNGEPIRMLPLRGEPNRYIRRFPIDFEARLLTSGTNVFGFEMLIPGDPPDLPCSATRGAVLEIAASSTLSVPFSPSMYLPDMGLAFTSLAPESLMTNDLSHLSFDADDRLVLSAALARAEAGYRPASLHLMSLDDLGSIPLGRYPLERRLLEEVLIPDDTQRLDGGAGGEGRSGDRPDPFRFVQEQRSTRAALAGWWDWVMGHATEFVQWVNPRTQNRLNDWLSHQRGQAVFLQLDDRLPDQIWMLRSADADIGDIAAAIIAARIIGAGPRGQVAVLDHDGNWSNWHAPDRRPVMLERWTLGNFRTALGNLVSARPITFVVILFFLALISAALALRLVVSTREPE